MRYELRYKRIRGTSNCFLNSDFLENVNSGLGNKSLENLVIRNSQAPNS